MMNATQVADAVAFALARPTETLVENITLSSLVGNL
jgi:NADP-dependent 3-hydroxy acid dehydrogenase YdfG